MTESQARLEAMADCAEECEEPLCPTCTFPAHAHQGRKVPGYVYLDTEANRKGTPFPVPCAVVSLARDIRSRRTSAATGEGK